MFAMKNEKTEISRLALTLRSLRSQIGGLMIELYSEEPSIDRILNIHRKLNVEIDLAPYDPSENKLTHDSYLEFLGKVETIKSTLEHNISSELYQLFASSKYANHSFFMHS